MNTSNPQRVPIRELIASVAAAEVWEYQVAATHECRDVTEATIDALQHPDDFPALKAAIIPGDRLALAVDPGVPQINEIIRGVMKVISQTDAGGVDIVLWDEATDETAEQLRHNADPTCEITRHISDARESLRYLAADESADPIYLNRRLVDADFILPIITARPLDKLSGYDLSGIFPTLSDSATRIRHREARSLCSKTAANREPPHLAWLLGVQLQLGVQVSAAGNVGNMIAGTIDAMSKRITVASRLPDEFPPASPLVIATLDGSAQQQSWINVARAAEAASRFVSPGGTIVLWTDIDQPPTGHLVSLSQPDAPEPDFVPTEQCEFPPWDATIEAARALSRLSDEHRILLHSQIDGEVIEAMGIGTVATTDELQRLSRSFPTCGVLRAAQFAGGTLVAAGVTPED